MLYELNFVPLVVINLLNTTLIQPSRDILEYMVCSSEISGLVIEQLLDQNMFRVLKMAICKHQNDLKIVTDLVIIVSNLTQKDYLKVKPWFSSEFVEILNGILENQESEDMLKKTITSILKQIN